MPFKVHSGVTPYKDSGLCSDLGGRLMASNLKFKMVTIMQSICWTRYRKQCRIFTRIVIDSSETV